MNETASDVIVARRARRRAPDPMLVWSVAAHIALLAIWLLLGSALAQTRRRAR